jgi:nucleotide-binding universal stress UspA family protein
VSPLGWARLAEQLLRTRHGGTEAEPRNPCSANVMSESGTPTQQRILVPLDFSEAARVALKTALRVANKPDDTVFLFYVPGLYRRTAQDRDALVNPFRVNIPETYGLQFLDWTRADNASGVRVEALPLMGLPDAGVIAEMARRNGSSLIIVVHRNYTLWQRLFGDCPTRNLSRVAPCRVQVVSD